MQDEINEKTIALYIKTGKLTAQTLQKAMKTLLAQMKKQKDKTPQGKQTLKQLISFYSPAWDLGTIWAPFTEKAPLIQAIKETPRTRKNIEFMRVSGVF